MVPSIQQQERKSPTADPKEDKDSQDGKKGEKSTGAPEKNVGSPEGRIWDDYTEVITSTVGE